MQTMRIYIQTMRIYIQTMRTYIQTMRRCRQTIRTNIQTMTCTAKQWRALFCVKAINRKFKAFCGDLEKKN